MNAKNVSYRKADVRTSGTPEKEQAVERTHKLWCRLDSETYEALQAAAQQDRRSLTQQVVIAIQTLCASRTR